MSLTRYLYPHASTWAGGYMIHTLPDDTRAREGERKRSTASRAMNFNKTNKNSLGRSTTEINFGNYLCCTSYIYFLLLILIKMKITDREKHIYTAHTHTKATGFNGNWKSTAVDKFR